MDDTYVLKFYIKLSEKIKNEHIFQIQVNNINL